MSKINNNLKALANIHKIPKGRNNVISTSSPPPVPKAVLLSRISKDPGFIDSSSFREIMRSLQPPSVTCRAKAPNSLAGDPTAMSDVTPVREEVFERWDSRPKRDTYFDWRKQSLFHF